MKGNIFKRRKIGKIIKNRPFLKIATIFLNMVCFYLVRLFFTGSSKRKLFFYFFASNLKKIVL